MPFDLNKCVNYISENTSKRISEAFGRWLVDDRITRIQWIALYFIYTRGEISQRDLAKLMNSNDSSAMRLVDRLEREGWLERARSLEDRRIVKLVLTVEGRELIARLLPIGEEFNGIMVEGIDLEELHIFQKVQQQMYDNIMNDSRSQK